MGIAAEEDGRHISISFSVHVHICSIQTELSYVTTQHCDNKIDTALPIRKKLRCGKIEILGLTGLQRTTDTLQNSFCESSTVKCDALNKNLTVMP
jgi:hypothetical protein